MVDMGVGDYYIIDIFNFYRFSIKISDDVEAFLKIFFGVWRSTINQGDLVSNDQVAVGVMMHELTGGETKCRNAVYCFSGGNIESSYPANSEFFNIIR